MLEDHNYLTPQQIVEELDRYIIGQSEAKRNVAIALRNRWRRMNAPAEMKNEIIPNNILMIGATGIGKTEIARRLATIAAAPFSKVEASKFTEVGYVGRDVESMIRDLVDKSVQMVQTEKKKQVEEQAAEAVEEKILDALIPPVSGEDAELNESTRERFRQKIRNHEIEERKVEISIEQNQAPNMGMAGPMGMDESSMINLQEMLSNMMPSRNKSRQVTIAQARRLLLEEETSKLIDMDQVKEEAIEKAQNLGIVFIDEIDKIARSESGRGSGDVSREGVQRDLLPIVEGSTVNTKHGLVKTDHILFVAAGAFHFSKPSDLIPELQGRFPIRVELESLTEEDFYRILKEPQNALTHQYEALFSAEGVKLEFADDALRRLAQIAYQANSSMENIGARRLHTVMTQLLNEYLYQVPDIIPANSHLVINADMVEEKLQDLAADEDLSEYIL